MFLRTRSHSVSTTSSASTVVGDEDICFVDPGVSSSSYNVVLNRSYYTAGSINIESVTCENRPVIQLATSSAVSSEQFVSNYGEGLEESKTASVIEESSSGSGFSLDDKSVEYSDNCANDENPEFIFWEPEIVGAVVEITTSVDDFSTNESSMPVGDNSRLESNSDVQTCGTEGSDVVMKPRDSVVKPRDSVVKPCNSDGTECWTTDNSYTDIKQNVETSSIHIIPTAEKPNSPVEPEHRSTNTFDTSLNHNSNETLDISGSVNPVEPCNYEGPVCGTMDDCGSSSASEVDELSNFQCMKTCSVTIDEREKLTCAADVDNEITCGLKEMDLRAEEGDSVSLNIVNNSKNVNVMSEGELDSGQSQSAADSDVDLNLGLSEEEHSNNEVEFPTIFTDSSKELLKSTQEDLPGLINRYTSSSKCTSGIADAINYMSTRNEERASYEKAAAKIPDRVDFHDEVSNSEIDLPDEPNEICPAKLSDPPPGLKIIVEANMFCLFDQKDVSLKITNCKNNRVSRYETLLMENPAIASKILPTAIAFLKPSTISNPGSFLTYLFNMAAVSSDFVTIRACEKTIRRFVSGEGFEMVKWCPSIDDLFTVLLNYGIDTNCHCPMKSVLKELSKTSENGREKCLQNPSWSVVGINFNAVIQILTTVLVCGCTYSTRELSHIITFLLWLSLDVKLLLSPASLDIQNCVAAALENISQEKWSTEMEFLSEQLCTLGHHHRNILKLVRELPSFISHGFSLQRNTAFAAIQHFLGIDKTDATLDMDCVIEFLRVIHERLGSKDLDDLCLLDTVVSLVNICVAPVLDKIPSETLKTLCSKVMQISAKLKEDCNYPEKHMVREHLVRMRCNWIVNYPGKRVLENEDSKESVRHSDSDSDTSSGLYSHGTSNECADSDCESYCEELCVLCSPVDGTQNSPSCEHTSSAMETVPSETCQMKPEQPDDYHQSCDVSDVLNSGNVQKNSRNPDKMDFSVDSSSVRTECNQSPFSDVKKPRILPLPSSDVEDMQICETSCKVIEGVSQTAESNDMSDVNHENKKSALMSQGEMKFVMDFVDTTNSFSGKPELSSLVSENSYQVNSPDGFESLNTKGHMSESYNTQKGGDVIVENDCKMTECQLTIDTEDGEFSENRSPVETESVVPTSNREVTMDFFGAEAPVNTSSGGINKVHQCQFYEKQNILTCDADNTENCTEKTLTNMDQLSEMEDTKEEKTKSSRTSESLDDGSRDDESKAMGGEISTATSDEHARKNLFRPFISDTSDHFYPSKESSEASGMEFGSASPNVLVQVVQNEQFSDHMSHSDTVVTESNISHISTQTVSVVGDTQRTMIDDSNVMAKGNSIESNISSVSLQMELHNNGKPPHEPLVKSNSVAFLDSVLTYKTNDPECIPFISAQSPPPGENCDVLKPLHHSHSTHKGVCNIPFLKGEVEPSLVQETRRSTSNFFESIGKNIEKYNFFDRSMNIPFISEDKHNVIMTSVPEVKLEVPQSNVDVINDCSIPSFSAIESNNTNVGNYRNGMPAGKEEFMQPYTIRVHEEVSNVFPSQYYLENPENPFFAFEGNTSYTPETFTVPYVASQDLCGTNGSVHAKALTPSTTSNVSAESRRPLILENVRPDSSVISDEQRTYTVTPPPLGLFCKNNKIPFISDNEADVSSATLAIPSVTASVQLHENVQSDCIQPVKTYGNTLVEKISSLAQLCILHGKDDTKVCSPLISDKNHSCSVTTAMSHSSSSIQNSSDFSCLQATSSVLSTSVGSTPSICQKIVKESSLSGRGDINTKPSVASAQLHSSKIALKESDDMYNISSAPSCTKVNNNCENTHSTLFVNPCTLTASEPLVTQESEVLNNFEAQHNKTVFLQQQGIVGNDTSSADNGGDLEEDDCVFMHEVITIPD